MRSDVVDSENVRMVQCRNRPCFLLKSPLPLRVFRERFGQYLYRDIAPKPGVPCTEYFSHAASAERSEDFIGA